jgi:DNA-binding XRE family transcriptional regulator
MDFVCAPSNDEILQVCDTATVADRNYLKQWRKKAGLSQEELADKVGTTKSVISLLESEGRPLSAKWLRKLDINPEEASADILDIWDHIGAKERPTAVRVLRSLTGTND